MVMGITIIDSIQFLLLMGAMYFGVAAYFNPVQLIGRKLSGQAIDDILDNALNETQIKKVNELIESSKKQV